MIDTSRMSDREKRAMVNAAIGRIFSMASRGERPGDVATYGECKSIVMQLTEELRGATAERPTLPAGELMRARAMFGESG